MNEEDDFFSNLNKFAESGILGNIPALFTAFGAKLGKNYILYQPDAAKEIKLDNEIQEMKPLNVTKIRIRTKDKIPLFGRVYSPEGANASTPIVFYFMSNAESIAAIADYVKKYCEKLKVHFIVYNFRGYGNSRGVPYKDGFIVDI